MQCVDEQEGAAAGAAINTIEVIAGAFGAGLAGVVVNSTQGGVAIAARALFAVFAARCGCWARWPPLAPSVGLRNATSGST